MNAVPGFLHTLDLDEGAQERDVRRAYAQRLKRIDQSSDPQGFQALREAYDAALQWIAWKERMSVVDRPDPSEVNVDSQLHLVSPGRDDEALEPEQTNVGDASFERVGSGTQAHAVGLQMPVVSGHPDAPPAKALAAEVFARFADRLETGAVVDEAMAERLLEDALCDERLVSLEAQTCFESSVLQLLAQGWRKGNEFLFGPACRRFEWETDSRRLTMFGDTGRMMDAAITQRIALLGHARSEHGLQWDIVRRLRSDVPPSRTLLAEAMPELEAMLRRYPVLLRIITDWRNVELWRAQWQTFRQSQRAWIVDDPPKRSAPRDPRRDQWIRVAVLLLSLAFVTELQRGWPWLASVVHWADEQGSTSRRAATGRAVEASQSSLGQPTLQQIQSRVPAFDGSAEREALEALPAAQRQAEQALREVLAERGAGSAPKVR